MQLRRVTRTAAALLAAACLPTAGVALAAGNSGTFKPGNGCGDKNHVHYKEGACKTH
jgi:hypothetical protein